VIFAQHQGFCQMKDILTHMGCVKFLEVDVSLILGIV
jgi:hypothetical protein